MTPETPFVLSPNVVDLLMGYIALVFLIGIGSIMWLIFGEKR